MKPNRVQALASCLIGLLWLAASFHMSFGPDGVALSVWLGLGGGLLGATTLDVLIDMLIPINEVDWWPGMRRAIIGTILGVIVGYVESAPNICTKIPGCIGIASDYPWQGVVVGPAFAVALAMTRVLPWVINFVLRGLGLHAP